MTLAAGAAKVLVLCHIFGYYLFLKLYCHAGALDVAVGEAEGLGGLFLGAGSAEDDTLVGGIFECAFGALAVEGDDLEVASHVLAVLAREFQRLVGAGGGDVELEVLGVAVEVALDGAGELDAVVDGDAVVAVDVDKNAVVGGNFEVHEELIAPFQRIVY